MQDLTIDSVADILYYLINVSPNEEHALTFLAGNHVAHCVSTVDKYFDGYSVLQYMEEGAVELFYGSERYLLEGSVFWPTYPGPHVRFHPAPGTEAWNHRHISFTGPLVERWRREGLFPEVPQNAPAGGDWSARLDALIAVSRSPARWARRRAINMLEGILLDLAEARAEPESPDPWLRDVLDRLEEGQNYFPDYECLARDCHMALSTLRRRFRQRMRISLHNYVLQSRIAEAQRLLAETDLSVSAVAERLGYRDVYFFSRQFRKIAGVPPTAFRESRQG